MGEQSSADDPPREPDLLGLVISMLEQYVVLKPHEYIAVALWSLHTHVYDRFMMTPRLALRSPVADCGKTTLLDVLARLTARADKFDAISTAAIFRLIDATHPTLLIDEADNLGLALQPNGRLRAVFNSGYRNGGTIAIQERGSLRRYSTFAPLALALPDTMLGLPRTLNSRSITIVMQRNAGQRELRRFDVSHPDGALDATYRQILLWRRDVELNSDPEMPAKLRNRMADNWRPLISIADSLGWGEPAREAMGIFAREFHDADVKILLLSDIRNVFDTSRWIVCRARRCSLRCMAWTQTGMNSMASVARNSHTNLKRLSWPACCANSKSGRTRSGRRPDCPKQEWKGLSAFAV